MKTPRTTKELRKFGLIMFLAFGFFAGITFWREKQIWLLFSLLAVTFLTLSVTAPKLLAPIEKAWLAFGEKLGMIVNIVVLFSTFYLVITPVALVFRLFGKDPLQMRIDKSASTYWNAVEQDGPGSRYFTPY